MAAGFQHVNHEHPLKIQNRVRGKGEIYCDGCDRYTTDNDPIFRCLGKLCPFTLHKSCAELPQEIAHHPFHPQHVLKLLARPPYDCGFFKCDACMKSTKGFTFHCVDCKFDLDVCCASLIPKCTIEDPHYGLDGTSHNTWVICDADEKFRVLCSACKVPVEYPICVCLECKVVLHKSCTQLPKKIEHPIHRPHPLVLFRQLPPALPDEGDSGSCSVCWDGLGGCFVYSCAECKFKLDTKCAALIPRTYDFHDHPLVLVDNISIFICARCECGACAPILHCVDDCGFNLHLHCVPSLPRTVKYERHLHPLTLTDSKIKDYLDEEDYEEFYCNACEELRSLADPTYYCEECHYVAHVRCMISDDELLSLGKELSAVGQGEDNSLNTAMGSMQVSTKKESVESIKVKQESKHDRTKLDKEIESVRSKVEALTIKLEALKQKRALASKAVILHDSQRP